MRERGLRAHDSVFMESAAPVSSAEIGAPLAVEFTMAFLCRDALRQVDRMLVTEAAQDRALVDGASVIERHQVLTNFLTPKNYKGI